MSAADLLANIRARQIATMEGREPPEAIVTTVTRPPLRKYAQPPIARIKITKHARVRMAQRRMSVSDALTILRFGERQQRPGSVRIVVTDATISDATAAAVPVMLRFRGGYIVIRDNSLVTVVADGEDSR